MESTLTQNCALYYVQHKTPKRRAALFREFRAPARKRALLSNSPHATNFSSVYRTRRDIGRKLSEAESGVGLFWDGGFTFEEVFGDPRLDYPVFRRQSLTALKTRPAPGPHTLLVPCRPRRTSCQRPSRRERCLLATNEQAFRRLR